MRRGKVGFGRARKEGNVGDRERWYMEGQERKGMLGKGGKYRGTIGSKGILDTGKGGTWRVMKGREC